VKRKSWIFWLSVGAVVLIVLNLPPPAGQALQRMTREALAPFQGLAANAGSRLRAAREALAARGGLPEQHRQLRAELIQLQNQLLEFEELRRENLLLRRQLGFVERAERDPVPAEVLARDISGWWQTVRVDHGGSAGVRADQAVITSEGLVGRVMDSSVRTADVLLITDPGCRVSVQIADKGAFAILSGQGLSRRGGPACRLELINKNARIERGDPVFTSGLGGIFPRGLLVGHIDEVYTAESGLHQSATVIPSADLTDLRVVFILTAPAEALR